MIAVLHGRSSNDKGGRGRMDNRRRSIILLEQADWGIEAQRIRKLKQWHFYPLVLEAIQALNVDALYKSPVHGSGHINRVLIMSALIASQEDLPELLLRQYLMVASYHDVGRYFDGLDLEHGSRSAEQLEELTGYKGEQLLEMQGAVAAHSQPDQRMEEMLSDYAPSDMDRARYLARLLKDADNLDRVRLGDLNPSFLRHESAKSLAGFSRHLFYLDQELKKSLVL